MDYYKIIKENIKDIYINPKAYVRTYGCQQNVADGEKIKGMLENMGYSLTDSPEDADFILFNTCAVREHAEDRVFGNTGALKNLKRKNKNLIIALCGCMMEQKHIVDRITKTFPFVNLIFGTHSLEKFPQLLYDTLNKKKGKIVDIGSQSLCLGEGLPIHRDSTFKAWLPIMYGCNNFCSYCIVPYARGRERSREFNNVISEAKTLIESGYKEITLLGQNVNSYGKSENMKYTFSDLLYEIDKIEGNYIIRFMTSHPKDLTHDIIDVIADSKHISKHLHLPVQSGNNNILKRMNRKYTREEYMQIVDYAKSKIKDLSLTSDIIVGFPNETEENFLDTVSIVKQVQYTSLFTFIYSKRKGTPAEKMYDPITHEEKVQRFAKLLEVQKDISSKICKSLVGRVLRVLVDDKNVGRNRFSAKTSGNIPVDIDYNENIKVGDFFDIEIKDSKNFVLIGQLEQK